MAIVATAAFDPIFVLHHCFIDKLFHIWYRINENSAITDSNQVVPFLKNETTCWIASELLDVGIFYEYLDDISELTSTLETYLDTALD